MFNLDAIMNNTKKRERIFSLTAEGFSIKRGDTSLFENTSITLQTGHKYGIIAPNGKGKSTLLQAIVTNQIPTQCICKISMFMVEQELIASDDLVFVYMINSHTKRNKLMQEKLNIEAQDDVSEESYERYQDVIQELKDMDAFTAEKRAMIILQGLQFTEKMINEPVKLLSGGWRMRLALAIALFIKPDILFLDEPTNHLDFYASIWLNYFLSESKQTLVIISHDKELLNDVCTDIYHIENKQLFLYKGNYDYFNHCYTEKIKIQEKLYNKQQKEMKDSNKNKQQNNKTKDSNKNKQQKLNAADNKKKTKTTKNRENKCIVEKERIEKVKPYQPSFHFPSTNNNLYPVIQVIDASFLYAVDFSTSDAKAYEPTTKAVLKNVDFSLSNDTRAAIIGKNGAGKTTLMNLLKGNINPTQGEVKINPKLVFGVFEQHMLEQLDVSLTPIEYLQQQCKEEISSIRKVLGRYGLTGSQHTTKIADLSGGQKVRIVFSEIYFKRPHILFLDEPTNHLDMESVDALIDAINDFEGAVIIITHNQTLVKQACKEFWLVKHQKVTIHHNYSIITNLNKCQL